MSHSWCTHVWCSRDGAAGVVPAHVSPLGRTPEPSTMVGPAHFLAAGVMAGAGQDVQCLKLCL